MTQPYKPTIFDKYGPDAGHMVRAFAYGLMAFGLFIPMCATLAVKLGLSMFPGIALTVLGPLIGGGGCAYFAMGIGNAAGNTWKRFVVDGTSTPYKEQYSYQQALVMQGKVDEALESFEAVIAEKPLEVDPRLKAAELYARERGNATRAAELFREVQRIPDVGVGEDVYASNRLVDLYTGPLAEPGRALVELRRLIDRYPGSAAAVHARDALRDLKARHATPA